MGRNGSFWSTSNVKICRPTAIGQVRNFNPSHCAATNAIKAALKPENDKIIRNLGRAN